MPATLVTTTDVTAVLEEALKTVEGLRVYRYVADNVRLPAAVISLPEILYDDPEATFCTASWVFPVALIVDRNQDRAAQDLLARLVNEAALAVSSAQSDAVFSIEPLSARPSPIDVSGTTVPGYQLRVRVRA